MKPHLQRIFFKEDHLKPTQESSGSSTGAAATEGGDGKKNEFHVAEQVSGIRQQFVFPDPLVPPSSDTPPSTSLMLTFTVGSHHKDKDIQQALSASTASPGSHAALILDVPLGMRLLNSYRLGYKDKIMRMWKKGRLLWILIPYFCASPLTPPLSPLLNSLPHPFSPSPLLTSPSLLLLLLGRPQPLAEESTFRTGSYNKNSSSSFSNKSGGGNTSTRSFPSFSSLTAAAGGGGGVPGSSGYQSSNDRLPDLLDDDKTMLNIQGNHGTICTTFLFPFDLPYLTHSHIHTSYHAHFTSLPLCHPIYSQDLARYFTLTLSL